MNDREEVFKKIEEITTLIYKNPKVETTEEEKEFNKIIDEYISTYMHKDSVYDKLYKK